MLEAIVWGILQGLTEFLPISSSGHLRLVPELLGTTPPSLATSAVLHLGTLLAVIAYYRTDLLWIVRSWRSDSCARRVGQTVIIATLPAVAFGFALSDLLDRLQESAPAVSIALLGNGLLLGAAYLFLGKFRAEKSVEQIRPGGAWIAGLAQAFALIPGISRSGMVIAGGIGLGLAKPQAARLAFLMSVPVIAGAGIWEWVRASDQLGSGLEIIVGIGVAALAGYAAISGLVKGLVRFGLLPFGVYCIGMGIITLLAI